MRRLLEISCYSVSCAIKAQQGGADRAELCAGRLEGGTTPAYGSLVAARELLSIPVFPILRPRGGDFCYSRQEFAEMKSDLALMRELGFPGVVTGMLTEYGQIDLARMQEIMALAGDMSVTFHRAFDMGADPMLMLQQLTDLGVDRILTSGQRDTAEQGLPLLEKLLAATQGPIILPGSGIRLSNMQLFLDAGATELHSSASHAVPSNMRYRQPGVSMNRDGGMDEYARVEVDAAVVTQMKALMRDTAHDPLA
ncbi:Copper homeostasis protein CutC [Plesiomonas shigelloides]|uniref:copper homeostasis protein CutC n=1 Tax=Plesiomonas shigelloides TaxID=703 RepID=UPI000D8089A4|nr:copper homeostasis protein CutC [Plesiomonas shigelloides]SPZ43771.1 Copper homeostasis protein CutC [Plesiomonas shigelloides]